MTNPKSGLCWSEQYKTYDNPNYACFICLSDRQYATDSMQQSAIKTFSKEQQASTTTKSNAYL